MGNLAFGTLFIFLLLLPGIAFRLSMLKSDSLRSNIDSSAINELGFTVMPAIFLHGLWTTFLSIIDIPISVDQIYFLIIGKENLNIEYVKKSVNWFFVYVGFISLLGSFLGFQLRKLIEKKNWDIKFNFLKISNEWDILFSGRKLDPEYREKLEFVRIDAVVPTTSGDVVYSGILEYYYLSKTGLDQIYLKKAVRRRFKKFESMEEWNYEEPQDANLPMRSSATPSGNDSSNVKLKKGLYAIKAGSLIIPFNQIKNLNVSYYTFEDAPENNKPTIK